MASSPESSPFPPGYLERDISGRLVAADTTILVVATLLLGLRLYVRSLKNVQQGWDDFLLPPAWLLLVGACVTGYLAVYKGGAGRHVEAIIAADPRTIVTRGKILYGQSWTSGLSNAFSRISITILYLRVFTTRAARIGSWTVLGYLVALVVAQIISGLLWCRPIAHFWYQGVPGGVKGTCIDLFAYYRSIGICNIVGDLAIMVLPIPTIWTLQASTARKVGLLVVFLSGSLGVVASCIRTSSFFTDTNGSLKDPTWTDASLMCWTIVESGMYASAACLIGLRPLLKLLPEWIRKHTTKNDSRNTATRRSQRSGAIALADDQDSTSHFFRGRERVGGGTMELRSNGQDLESGRAESISSREIRVESEVKVASEGKDNYYPNYYPS